MPRRRRVLAIALLLALLGADGGYRLAHGGGPSPVLRTITVGDMPGQVVVDAATDRAFVNNYDDQSVSVLNATTGTELHTIPIGDYTGLLGVDVPTDRLFVVSDDNYNLTVLDATNGTMVETTQNAGMETAVDARTGHLFMTYQTLGFITASVYMLDGRTGELLHATLLKGVKPEGVAVDELTDRVFASTRDDNTVGMIEAGSGRLLRAVKVGSTPLQVAVDAQTGHVFVPNNGANTVSMLDARSGDLLRTIGVGRHPISLAVDEATARLFVVNSNAGCVRPAGPWQYVPSFARWLLPFLPGPPTPTCNWPGSVSVIDTSHL